MLENILSQSTIAELLGQSLFEVWQELCSAIDAKYEMDRFWNTGGKNWTYDLVVLMGNQGEKGHRLSKFSVPKRK